MNIEQLNRNVLKQSNQNQQNSHHLEKNFVKEVFKKKHSGYQPQQDKADMLLMKIHPSPNMYLKQERIDYLKGRLHEISNQNLISNIPSNNRYFFLSELRENHASDEKSILKLALKYHLTANNVQELKDRKFFDYLTEDELKTPLSEMKQNLIDRRFLSVVTETEKQFMKEVLKLNCFQDSKEFKDLKEKFEIDNSSIIKLVSKGHLHILNSNQVDFLKAGAKYNDLKKFGLSNQDYFNLKERIGCHKKGDIKYINDKYVSKKERVFIQDLSLLNDKEAISRLEEYAGFKKDHISCLKKRIHYFDGSEIKAIDFETRIDLSDKLSTNVQVKYSEHTPILNFRPNIEINYKTEVKAKDILIYLRGLAGETLNKRENDRYFELKCHQLKLSSQYIPTNNELLLLRRINFRKTSMELALKIANNDFKIHKSRVYELFSLGYFEFKNGSIRNLWKDPEFLANARIWQSLNSLENQESKIYLSKKLNITEPNLFTKSLLENNSNSPLKPSLDDYELFLKTIHGERLDLKEEIRLQILRENGIHPELEKDWLGEIPASFHMKKSRNLAFNNFFKERNKPKIEILEFVNKFKQVTHDQLLSIGLTNSEIEKYVRGIKDDSYNLGGKLLRSHQLETPRGRIKYYSIAHEGTVSGRSLLEEIIPSDQISRQPQKREDLLFHDLKVVDCVLKVKGELEAKGYKIQEIKNESMQYSETKAGKDNNWRSGGPSFMDAILTVEEPYNEIIGACGGSKTIAVEYGNYSKDRMGAKINNSIYDEAFVFSNQQSQKVYSKILTNNMVNYRVI